jgi:3-oxoacyl-(acyl-carrier-protein) synthase
MGVLAPNGIGLKAFWQSLIAGESGIGPITLFDASGFKSRIAGEVKNFNPDDYIGRLGKTTQAFARHATCIRGNTIRSARFENRSVTPFKYRKRTVTDSLGGRDQRNGRFTDRIRFFAGSRPGFDQTVCSRIVCTSSRRKLHRPKARCANKDIDNIVNLCRGP